MAKEKKSATGGKNEVHGFDFGIGGLFKGLEKLLDLAGKLEEAGGEIKKEGEIDLSHLKKGMKGVFGFSVKTATGKTVVEPFGNIKKTPKGPNVSEEREPITDIFDEKEELKIYAEMPGVNEEDIKIDLKGDILEISAKTGDRKYHKEILLSTKIRPDTMSFSYKNGMLEVKYKKS
ncbi:MAG: Hsp20/alpha crystallin family protein [bacterium]